MPPRNSAAEFHPERRRACCALAALTGGIALVWSMLLPWIAERPLIARRLDELDRQGIDPSAMFYSELPAMEEVRLGLDRLRRDQPRLFWSP